MLRFCLTCLAELSLNSLRQENKIGAIMTQLNELAAKLQAANAQTLKGINEVQAKVADLQAALENAQNTTLPPDVEEALANLFTTVQALDDLNPDPVVEPAPVEETPVEEAPAEDTPAEPAPEAPAEEAPVEEAEIQPGE